MVENDSMPALFLDGGGLGGKENGGALWACGQMDLGEVWPCVRALIGDTIPRLLFVKKNKR